MFKNKIAAKLATVFILLVIICMSLLAYLFMNIYTNNHIKYKTDSMLKTARQIARMPEINQMDQNKLQADNALLEYLDYGTDSRIWIVDSSMKIVVRSYGNLSEHEIMGNCLLPQNDINFMTGVLSGKEMVSYDNINFYDVAMLSVGVPIEQNGKIIGAVLLHTTIDSLGTPIRQTAWYLILAILVSTLVIIISVGFYAVSFTKPLKTMKNIAGEMINGNYSVKTHIKQKDEIGDLANSMDILAVRLEEARKETEKLEQIRRDFVANVSHEFRTPLTILKGNLETLIDAKVQNRSAAYDTMLTEINALEKLVGDLLDLSRIESGKLELNFEEVDIKSVLSDVIRSISSVAKQKDIHIDTLEISGEIPPIRSDYYRLRQVLIVFLSNAIKYSENHKTIHIKTDVSDKLTIQIKDEGVGINEEDMEYVWDRFYKSDKMRADNTSAGLGLSIAKNLITALGGKVQLKSVIDVGTTVIIKLPI